MTNNLIKNYKELGREEFMKRFKQGVQKVTPLQQSQMQLYFSTLTIIGILCGIVVSIWKWQSLWWLAIILLAALGNTTVAMIGIYQKYSAIKNIENQLKEELKGGEQNGL